MQLVIIRISATVEIEAHPVTVFARVSDANSKAGLNPFIRVIRIEREDRCDRYNRSVSANSGPVTDTGSS